MVESVALALEIKSDLDRAEIENIFSKTAGLRTLAVGFPSPGGATVMVSAFAYQCANPHLAYFDFAAASMLDPASSPREICALNVGIFTHSQVVGGNQSLSSQANRNSTPVFLPTEKDSLLLWVYLLCRWLGRGASRADLFRPYSEELYSQLRAGHFDRDFLEILRTDPEKRATARQFFARRADHSFDELYGASRAGIGLPELTSKTDP